MVRYAAARLAQGLVAVFVVLTLVFFMARIGSDPAALLAPPDATTAQIDAIRHDLGFDRPVPIQYADYLKGILTGDLGESTSYKQPVTDLVLPAMGHTAQLALSAFVLALLAGVTLGSIAGIRSGGWLDRMTRLLAVVGQSVPSFWLGMILVLLFAVQLQWLPAFGSDSISSLVLPTIALAAYPTAAIARITRSAVVELVGRDQTLFLRSKGVSPRVFLTHLLRNASLPVVTLAGIQLGALFSGTIVIETLFAWPGVGQLAIQSIQSRDFAMIQGIVIVNTVLFVGLLFLVDLSYGLLDPRVRGDERRVRRRVVVAEAEAAA